MGGNKATTIEQHPILKWNYERFKEYLAKPGMRLMVIGYSFGDYHINQAIAEVADRDTLRLFIIDPLGVDVLDKNRNAPIPAPDPLFTRLQPHVVGASRRTVRDIFGRDRVEHAKVMRFFHIIRLGDRRGARAHPGRQPLLARHLAPLVLRHRPPDQAALTGRAAEL
jgi:hypothetical protein